MRISLRWLKWSQVAQNTTVTESTQPSCEGDHIGNIQGVPSLTESN